MPSNSIYYRLNVLFPTDESVRDTIQRLKRRAPLPEKLGTNEFHLHNDKLFYSPSRQNAPKHEVIPPSKAQEVLQNLWKNDWATLGKSMTTLYKYVRRMYVNITRDDCKKFLEGKELSQLTRASAPPIRKPIIALYPNALWCIDLIDLSTQNRHRSYYMLNTVDAFSRRCFLESISAKTAPAVLQALQRTMERAGVQPHRILSDNAENFRVNLMNG
jgi:transposase InsO family protein